MIIAMSRVKREQSVEFACTMDCDLTYMVDGYFNADGEFEPTTVDEMGSDMDCPECGERGEPTDHDVTVADL
jgi:hypothetical protein